MINCKKGSILESAGGQDDIARNKSRHVGKIRTLKDLEGENKKLGPDGEEVSGVIQTGSDVVGVLIKEEYFSSV